MLGQVVGIAATVSPGILKVPTPRQYGKLPGTIIELQEGVEGKTANLNGRTYNAVQTVQLMDSERKRDSGMQGIWTDLLPTWSPTPAALAEIQRLDTGFKLRGGAGGAGSSGGTPDMSAERPAPANQDKTEKPASLAGALGTLPLWMTLLIAGGLGYVAYKAFKG